ncbi:MAG: hypothetical protein NDJ92_05845 [Thermoanaerobaculia bacterium]|nr:hypothetical protein [Thermoanaerobaculia bacterium]
MSGRAVTKLPGASRGGIAPVLRALLSCCAVLSLRWPMPVFWASVRGEGAIDGTIGAFLVSFVLGLLGLPGFLAALWGRWTGSGSAAPRWIRLGLVATLASSLTTATWIAVSVREIGSTLTGLEVALQLAPVATVALAAVALRIRVARVTRH